MFIGQNLRRERESKGWSQEALGHAAGGISQTTISLMESDKQEAGLEQIINLARALEIPTEKLTSTNGYAVVQIENQKGHQQLNNGTNYISNRDGEVAVLQSMVDSLREENAFLRSMVEKMAPPGYHGRGE